MVVVLRTSIGIHTFSIFRRFDHKGIVAVLKDVKQYSKATGRIMIYPTNKAKSCYKIDYTGRDAGIDYWQIRFCTNPTADFKEYIVEAKINPKILAGEIDYVRAANERHVSTAILRFNEEAKKLSKHLGSFDQYRPNRVDYCVNFDLLELEFPCSPEQMMELIKRSNVPAHYAELKEYDPVGHRMKSLPGCFYLKSNSVVFNGYGKHFHLSNHYPDNPSLEDAQSVVRLEVQCKYMKLYAMLARAKRDGIPDYALTRHLLSDAVAREMIINYFDRVIMCGDYYTLREATEKITARRFGGGKGERMIDALNLISQQRSIQGAKDVLRLEGGDLSRFNRALHELVDDMRINPVTIPKSFGIRWIPSLLEAFLRFEW